MMNHRAQDVGIIMFHGVSVNGALRGTLGQTYLSRGISIASLEASRYARPSRFRSCLASNVHYFAVAS